MKFPVTIRHRSAKVKIYGPTKHFDYYRLASTVAGRRRMQTFANYSDARAAAQSIAREIAAGSEATALSARQSRDAVAALERLDAFHQATGRKVSLLGAVSEFCEAAGKLRGRTLGEAVEKYLDTVAVVKRKDITEAAAEFIQERESKTVARDGRRPQLSAGYHYNVSMWLREFAATFPGHAVADLGKPHLDAYMAAHAKLAPKTRNERRNVVRMFLKWCVSQDYLAATHRLLEAPHMKHETADTEDIECYTAAELRTLLENADNNLRPVLALCALGGVRLQEAARLAWEDVWRVPGHVEISQTKSKTRQRRLISVGPALAAWLEPYRACTGPIWRKSIDMLHEDFGALRESLKIPARRNGLRHGFVSCHFALHANENLTAAEAGNSPGMVHKNYKGLVTKAEAEKWFAVCPAPAAANVIPLPKDASA